MEKKYCVYCHTNKVNGKKYIGITSQKPERRWAKGKGYMKNTYMRRAIDKYGWDSFVHSVLYSELSAEEAEAKEIELIKKFNTLMPFGYNAEGGGNLNKNITPETRAKQSLAKKGRPITERQKAILASYRGPLSEETKIKIGLANKGKPGNNRGKHFSEEIKAKMSASSLHRRCKCLDTGIIYESLKDAAIAVGGTLPGVCSVCKGGQKTHRGFRFAYED